MLQVIKYLCLNVRLPQLTWRQIVPNYKDTSSPLPVA